MKKYTDLMLIFVVVLGLAFCGNVQAADVTWDITPGTVGAGDSAVTGGAGTWDTINGNWTIDNGVNNIAWVNANNDTAVFGGTAGMVTLGEGITVGGLTFNIDAYTVTNNTLTFGSAGTISNAVAATIAAAIAGTDAITKDGAGELTLSGNNTFTGNLIINGGTLTLFNTNACGDITVNGSILISGGIGVGPSTLGAEGGTITFNGNSTFNPQRGNTGAYNKNVVVNGTNTFSMKTQFFDETFSGVLSGSGTIIQNNSNGELTFSNPANTFTGAIRLDTSGTPATYNGVIVHSLADSANPITFNHFRAVLTFAGDAATSTSLLFNSRQMVLATSGTIKNINSDINKTITINTDLAYSGGVDARTLTLSGTNTGANAFAGAITNGLVGGTNVVISLTKESGGTWSLSGTNTYSGTTLVDAGWPAPGQLIFQGKQAVSPNTTFETRHNSGATAKLVFLDDSPGVINLGNPWTFRAENKNNATANTHIFVGNNSTTNGGSNPGSTQTGSTIALGGYFSAPETGTPSEEIINITGANGYRLQLASLQFTPSPGKTNTTFNLKLNPTTAPVTIAGNVTAPMDASSSGVTNVLALEGTALDNLISGEIADPTGAANIAPLNVTKSNTSTWILSGINTFSGTTTITDGTLVIDGGERSQCLSDTNSLTISGTGKLQLNAGVRERVGSLVLGTTTNTLPTTWGSVGSSAANQTNTFLGTGVLYVNLDIPTAGTVILLR